MVVNGTQRFLEKAIKGIKDLNRKNLVSKDSDWLHSATAENSVLSGS